MASTEESDKHEGVAEDDFEVFVNLLQEHTIMFDKQKTPGVRKKKEEALESLTIAYNVTTKQNLSEKQILKKFNNIKTRIKSITDNKRTGNRKIHLRKWESRFYDLWNGNGLDNPVLNRIPGEYT